MPDLKFCFAFQIHTGWFTGQNQIASLRPANGYEIITHFCLNTNEFISQVCVVQVSAGWRIGDT